jgi:mRNA interferase MazF
VSASDAPDRGDTVWLDFAPRLGHERDGRRPALVLSPRAYHVRTGLALVCPITREAKGYPFEVALPAGFPVDGAVLADQVKSVDWRSRHSSFIARAPDEVVRSVGGLVSRLLPRYLTRGT